MAALTLVLMALLALGAAALAALSRQGPALVLIPVCLLVAGVVVFVLGGA